MKITKSALLVVAQIYLLLFSILLVRAEMNRADRRLVREAKHRIELRQMIGAAQYSNLNIGRRVDMLVELNLDSIVFFEALCGFDESNSRLMGPHWREAVYQEYGSISLEFRGKYAALMASMQRIKRGTAPKPQISQEDELKNLLAARKELEGHERAFSELSERFEKLIESVYSGADDDLKRVLLPYHLKWAKDKLDYDFASLPVFN
ncbi:MAG: hypothetical protein Q8P49_00065 [Candidatus Liptonbacteria bacterium]|nr:hypothetical protein [Candidatus Liptonbacteria bacterium]